MLSHPVVLLLAPLLLMGSVRAVQPLPSDSNADGVSDAAPALRYYAAIDGETALGPDSDPHAVHGIALEGGGFALTGKYDTGGGRTAGFLFAMPTPPRDAGYLSDGNHQLLSDENSQAETWMSTFASGGNGNGGGNQVAEIGNALYVAGFSSGSAYVYKYQAATGQLVWDIQVIIGGSSVSALESITPTADGGIVVGGLVNSESECLEGFKSYGNPACGTAALAYYTSNQIQSPTAPQQPTWTRMYPGFISVKSVKEIPPAHGHGFALATSREDPEGLASVIRTDSNGNVLWQEMYPDHGEVTDIVVLGVGETLEFLISGHRDSGSGLYGALSKIDDAGARTWTKEYGGITGGKFQFTGIEEGNPNGFVYHECWGIVATPDESQVVLACGTGIEGCDGRPASCNADPRTNWRSMLLAVDSANGDVLWHRLDSYEPEGANTVNVGASASEFAVVMDGGILSTNDEGFGFSAMVTESLVPAPPTAPTPAPAPTPDQSGDDDDQGDVNEPGDGDDSPENGGDSLVVVVGVLVGFVLVVAVAGAFVYVRKRRGQRPEQASDSFVSLNKEPPV